MAFDDKAKLKALAIVHVFETSKPFGDYSAVAVLNDGAGVSYGINQFTHRSGSLYAVVNTYLGEGGLVGQKELTEAMPTLRKTSPAAIAALSSDRAFKDALKRAGRTPEMHLAQQQIMENMYLLPAVDACEGSDFRHPLSLAVVYDSINHGSFARIRDTVKVSDANEEGWITEYVRHRHAWLSSVPRLKSTNYRTKFFLDQIARGNWDLDLPLNVHGVRLTEKMFQDSAATPAAISEDTPADGTPADGPANLPEIEQPPTSQSVAETATASTTGEASLSRTVTTEANVAVEKENLPPENESYLKRKWKQVTMWWASIGGLETVRSNSDTVGQMTGGYKPDGVIIGWIIVGVIVLFFLWFFGGWILERVIRPLRARWLTTSLIKANTTPTNQVIVVEADKLAELEKAGWVVVRRK